MYMYVLKRSELLKEVRRANFKAQLQVCSYMLAFKRLQDKYHRQQS